MARSALCIAIVLVLIVAILFALQAWRVWVTGEFPWELRARSGGVLASGVERGFDALRCAVGFMCCALAAACFATVCGLSLLKGEGRHRWVRVPLRSLGWATIVIIATGSVAFSPPWHLSSLAFYLPCAALLLSLMHFRNPFARASLGMILVLVVAGGFAATATGIGITLSIRALAACFVAIFIWIALWLLALRKAGAAA